jgi:guanylate kinase/deoxycytidine triphosphate deaminase
MIGTRGIILTGTSGAGKTAIARRLCVLDNRFGQVRSVTTRTTRADDVPGEYEYVSKAEFDKRLNLNQFLIHAEYMGHSYAIQHSDFNRVISSNKIPVLTITPDSVRQLTSPFLSYFVDAPKDELLDSRLSSRGALDTGRNNEQRTFDRQYVNQCRYTVINNDLETTVNLVSTLWDVADRGGVLSDRIIRLMLNCGMLLSKADERRISGASYDLSLGDEYFYGGKIHHLSDSEPILLIEPYDYAVVTSHELSSLPTDVCARFDLSVSLFTQGVLLSNGPQIDPGFIGPLFCLLFNTSSSPVLLKRRQHYATLEFHKMIEPTYSYKGPYMAKDLLHYLPSNAARGAINELKKELEEFRKESQMQQGATWALLALILALITAWMALK